MVDNKAVAKGNSTLLGEHVPPTPKEEKDDGKDSESGGDKSGGGDKNDDNKDSDKNVKNDKDTKNNKDTKDTKNNKEDKNKKNIEFKTAHPLKLGTLMADSTEVIEVDDVIDYKNNFKIDGASNLEPYVIYLDSKYKQVVQNKKRNKALILLLQVFGGCVCFILIVVLVKKFLLK